MTTSRVGAATGGRRMDPPFRADHVGSLLRPPELHVARSNFKAGRIDAVALREVEDQAILDAIDMQHDVGLQTATDGEFRRTAWHMDFIYQLHGIEQVEGESLHVQFKDENGEIDYAPPAMKVTGAVDIDQTIFADAFTYLRDHAYSDQTPKLTIPSPSMVHYRGGNSSVDASVYPEIEGFWEDLTAAYAKQIKL